MTDNERIADYLEEHGSITSYEMRVKGLTGNPAQRCRELRDRGYKIATENFRRDGRPCCRYTLISTPLRPDNQGRDGERDTLGAPEKESRVQRRKPSAALNSGAGTLPAQRGGDGDPSPTVTALPTLFAPDEFEFIVPVGGHYGQDA